MKKKIVLLPLDERPCNYNFPEKLFCDKEIEIVKPMKLGDKKNPAEFENIKSFLISECKNADGLILSIDMLLYGGLIPSRIHELTVDELEKRLDLVKDLRKTNPKLIIYAFNVIMRCPNYSSDDEEPDYYLFCGKEIHDLGVAVHKSRAGIESSVPVEQAMEQVDKKILNDYIGRRKINLELNLKVLKLAKDGFLDGLVIPQDDSAEFGYAAMDQMIIREKVAEFNLKDTVLIYPGADEVELTLMARLLNSFADIHPKVYAEYFNDKAKNLIPLYEGAPLDKTVQNHIISAGCSIASSEDEADIVLFITAPHEMMQEAIIQPSTNTDYTGRNLDILKKKITKIHDEGKYFIIADNAYANGGDLSIIELLNNNDMLLKVDGYAGWNTSANTIGTAIAEGCFVYLYGKASAFESFLVSRYIEDGLYCGKVRGEVTDDLPKAGFNYFDVKDKNGVVSFIVTDRLMDYIYKYLSSVSNRLENIKVTMPWRRMFEIDLEINLL